MIKFKGKHVSPASANNHLTGTWVYGYLTSKNYINAEHDESYYVDTDTICMSSDTYDTDRNLIYEKDCIEITNKHGKNKIFKVYLYGNTLCVNSGIFCGKKEERIPIDFLCYKKDYAKLKVIGNLIDNPELKFCSY